MTKPGLPSLLAEWCKHQPEFEAAFRFDRLQLEERLLRTLETEPFPEFREAPFSEAQRFCGFYRSSLFLALLLRWSEPVGPGTLERILRWETTHVEPLRAEIQGIVSGHGYDFLWLPAILDLLDDSAGRPIATQPEQVNLEEPWPRKVRIRTVHRLGRELSRTWSLAALAYRGNARADGRYKSRVCELLQRRELWAEDFKVCSHWIPQYLFVGDWIRAGRP